MNATLMVEDGEESGGFTEISSQRPNLIDSMFKVPHGIKKVFAVTSSHSPGMESFINWRRWRSQL